MGRHSGSRVEVCRGSIEMEIEKCRCRSRRSRRVWSSIEVEVEIIEEVEEGLVWVCLLCFRLLRKIHICLLCDINRKEEGDKKGGDGSCAIN